MVSTVLFVWHGHLQCLLFSFVHRLLTSLVLLRLGKGILVSRVSCYSGFHANNGTNDCFSGSARLQNLRQGITTLEKETVLCCHSLYPNQSVGRKQAVEGLAEDGPLIYFDVSHEKARTFLYGPAYGKKQSRTLTGPQLFGLDLLSCRELKPLIGNLPIREVPNR